MNKQVVSILLALIIAFPSTLFAQQPQDSKYNNWEFNIANAKLLSVLLSIPDPVSSSQSSPPSDVATFIASSFMGLFTGGSLGFIYHSANPAKEWDISKRNLSSLSEYEILTTSRFEKYLTIYHTEFEEKVASEVGSKKFRIIKNPGYKNPILRNFRELNRLMSFLNNSLEFNPATSEFRFKDVNIARVFHVEEVRKIFKSLQIATQPETWLQNSKTLIKLSQAIDLVGVEKVQRITSLITPQSFDVRHPATGAVISGKDIHGNQIDFAALTKPASEYYSMLYDKSMMQAHERILQNRIWKSRLKAAGIGALIAVAVTAVAYFSLKHSSDQHTSIVDQKGLTPEDVYDIMFAQQFPAEGISNNRYDPEMVDMLLRNNFELAQTLSIFKDYLDEQIQKRNRNIPVFDQYIAAHPELFKS